MNRRDGTKNSGFVKFPTETYSNSREGGMFVYAVVPRVNDFNVKNIDPFIHCGGVAFPIPYQELLIDRDDKEKTFFPRLEANPRSYDSVQFLAVVCLGTSGGSWWNDETGNWECTLNDLTPDGEELVLLLEKLYSRPVHLLTWLDT